MCQVLLSEWRYNAEWGVESDAGQGNKQIILPQVVTNAMKRKTRVGREMMIRVVILNMAVQNFSLTCEQRTEQTK